MHILHEAQSGPLAGGHCIHRLTLILHHCGGSIFSISQESSQAASIAFSRGVLQQTLVRCASWVPLHIINPESIYCSSVRSECGLWQLTEPSHSEKSCAAEPPEKSR